MKEEKVLLSIVNGIGRKINTCFVCLCTHTTYWIDLAVFVVYLT